MKPAFHLLPTTAACAACAALLLAGCGQKGPLYLPKKPVPAATTQPATAPADKNAPASQ